MVEIIICILLLIIFATFRIRNNRVRWFFILFPPLTLIVLIWVPWDMPTVILWGPAMFAVLFSVLSIIIQSLIALIRKLKKKKKKDISLWIKLVRPTLVICVVVGAHWIVGLSLKTADIYAVETTKRIQLSCNDNSICPEIIQGWKETDSEWNNCIIRYGKYGTKYLIYYSTNEDQTEFTFKVRHNIDEMFSINGGVGRELEARISVCGNTRTIDINTLKPIDFSEEVVSQN